MFEVGQPVIFNVQYDDIANGEMLLYRGIYGGVVKQKRTGKVRVKFHNCQVRHVDGWEAPCTMQIHPNNIRAIQRNENECF